MKFDFVVWDGIPLKNDCLKCKWSEDGECTFNDENKCNGTEREMWECAYCGDDRYWSALMKEKENENQL